MQKHQHYWTAQEIAMLKLAARELGKQWRKIRKLYFPYMSDEMVRNKFYKLGLHSSLDIELTESDRLIVEEKIMSDIIRVFQAFK